MRTRRSEVEMVQGSIHMQLARCVRRRICLSLSLFLPATFSYPFHPALSLPPSLPLSLSLFLPPFLHHSRLVDPKYQRTIKYSSDDSFVTDERREPRARACDINVYIREDEDSDRLCRR